VFTPMAWATVVIELGAPLALLGGRIRTAWAVGAWGFHVGIVVLMAISFPYQVAGIAYVCLFAPERAVDRATAWWRARRPAAIGRSGSSVGGEQVGVVSGGDVGMGA
jgi:hypothetical protein